MSYKKAKIDKLLDLSKQEIKDLPKEDKIAVLEKLVKYHNDQYFIENDPVISDEYFDNLTEMLRKLDPSSTVLFEIVGEIGSVTHPKPMLSIEKKYDYENIKKWVIDTKDKKYLIEPKYDGMAARYDGEVLATRGNGRRGEDITERFRHLNIQGDIKKAKKNNSDNSVYGEIVIPNEYFQENLAEDYKNSRNAVVGIMKAKQVTDAGIKALRDGGVHFVIFDQDNALKVKKDDLLNEEEWESLLEEIFRSPYPLDGAVIKVTDSKLKDELGATQHHYKYEVAYKVPAEKKWSEVVDITDSVGRTGRVTSIANIKPVELSGATVTNVTLHNFEFVKESKIGVGSEVEVMRSGEVIPYVTQVEPAKKPHKPPKKCPVCNTKLKEYGKYLECPNPQCPARLSQSIEYFFKTLDVDELGLKTIEKFIETFDLENVIDFYDLKREQIEPLEGFGKKSADNIVGNVQKTLDENIMPYELLQALGIKEIGPATSRWIINKYGFNKLPELTKEEVEQIDGMGPKKAESFVSQIKNKWWIVEDLKKRGLKFKAEKKTNKLKGKTFSITGRKEQYSRDELIEIIEQNGGEYKSSVTQDLDYLVAGENAGSKLDRAKEVGAEVIDEDKLLQMIK